MSDTHTLTLDDIFAIENVLDAQISPDGSQIAFVVARNHTQGEHKLPASSIWLVPFDGSAPARRLTHSPRADHSPRWSPKGDLLAFLSDREKMNIMQIHILPLNGGEARRLTETKAGVTEFQWSPDGKRIAYLAPDAESEEEEKRKKELDDAIHVNHDYKFTRLWVMDVSGGAAQAFTPPEYQVRSFAWYADGWAALISSTPLEDDFSGWRMLYVIEGQPAKTLWQMRHGSYRLVRSSDGRSLAWIHTGADATESVDELWVLLPDESPRLLMADYAGGMVWTDWLPDGKSLLVTAVDSTHTLLGRVTLAGGQPETLLSRRTLAEGFVQPPCASVSRDGRRMAYIIEDGVQPADVWANEPGSEPRQVTRFNHHLGEVALGAVETIHWQAPDGLAIEGVLIYPAGYESGRPYPLIVQIHGGPTWQWLQRFMANWHDWGQWLATHGYAILLPNPRGSFGRGRDFAWRNRRAWGIGDLDDVMSGIDHLAAIGLVDPERLGIGGWSYGGYLTAWAIGHTDRFKAAVVGAGVTNLLSFQASDIPTWLPNHQMLTQPYHDPELYLRCSPIHYAQAIRTPTLILHGAADERVRLGQGRELYHALRALKTPTEMAVYPREGHLINERHHQRDLLERVVGWFNQWLKPGETT